MANADISGWKISSSDNSWDKSTFVENVKKRPLSKVSICPYLIDMSFGCYNTEKIVKKDYIMQCIITKNVKMNQDLDSRVEIW